jgi:hypothetical protein
MVLFQDILNKHYHRNLDHNHYNRTVLFAHHIIHINLMVFHQLNQIIILLLLIMLYNHGQI